MGAAFFSASPQFPTAFLRPYGFFLTAILEYILVQMVNYSDSD